MKKGKTTQIGPTRLHKTIFQARFKPSLKFFELLYPLAQKFEKDYPKWNTDRLSASLFNYEKRCSIAIAPGSFSYHQDSEKVSEEELNLQGVLENFPQSLKIESYTRIGYRRKYLIPTDMSFKELVNVMNLKLFSQNAKLTEIMPPYVNDLQYVIDYSDDRFRYHFRMGPVKGSEIPRLMEFQKEHLDPSIREREYEKINQNYPKVAVFLDIDLFREEEKIPIEDGPIFLKEAREKAEAVTTDLRDYIF